MAEVHDLKGVIDRISEAGDEDDVSVNDLLETFGQRTFGPLLLVPSILLVSPLSGVPGAGTVGAIVIGLIAAHIALARDRLWLPGFVRRRKVKREKLKKATRFLRKPASFIDRLIKPRLVFLTSGVFVRLIGVICLTIALVMPPLELVPMANSTTAAAVAAFALALVSHDGLLVLLALAVTAAGLYMGMQTLVF